MRQSDKIQMQNEMSDYSEDDKNVSMKYSEKSNTKESLKQMVVNE